MLRRDLSDEWLTPPPSFLAVIANDPELHPEIRDNAITVYYRAAALFRDMRLQAGRVTAGVHFKYIPVQQPDGSRYVDLVGGEEGFQLPQTLSPLPLSPLTAEVLSEYKRVMRSANSKQEADIVHELVGRAENIVVDQEIEFQMPGESSDKIDICQYDTGLNCLAFVEVKGLHDRRLRSIGGGAPEVVDQMRRYGERIEQWKKCIVTAYQRVIELKRKLGLESRLEGIPLDQELREDQPLRVLRKPKLVIGGCTRADVQSIRRGEGEWKLLLEGLQKESAGLILCGKKRCNLNARNGGGQSGGFDQSLLP